MKNNITCRVADTKDLPAILSLYGQPTVDSGEVLNCQEAENIFNRMSLYPFYKIYVAETHEHRIVGTFALLIMENIGHMGAPSAIIEDVAVDPAFHRMSIGRCMMDHSFSIAKEKGCYKVVLSANLKRKQAHIFYESIGFERHGYSFKLNISDD